MKKASAGSKSIAKSADKATKLVLLCARAAIDKKANHSLIYNIGKVGAFTDYFFITSATSDKQVQAIAHEIQRLCRENGYITPRMEGLDEGRWVLIDFGSVVIHIFQDAIREFYDLETLWAAAPRLGIPEEYYTSPSTAVASSRL